MNFAPIIAKAFLRKLGYTAAALLVAAAMGYCSNAKAQAPANICNTINCDEGEAYSLCMTHISWVVSNSTPATDARNPRCERSGGTQFAGKYTYYGNCPSGCPAANGIFKFVADCSARNGQGQLADAVDYRQTGYMTCAGGCKIQGNFGSTSPAGGVTYTTMTDRTYDGDVCMKPGNPPKDPVGDSAVEQTEEKKPKPPECTALGGGQTGCVKSNGDYCATASTGKTFCWQPAEKGTKNDGKDAQVKSEIDNPVKKPDVLIPDTDWQRTQGHQAKVCIGTTCLTYNITNFIQKPGAGSANNSTGNNTGDGTGNTSGNGTGTGTGKPGEEEGEGDSASDSGNCETAPSCNGDTLKCLHLKFTWKIQCHTKGDTITKGTGCTPGDVPVCAGSSCQAAAYSQLLQAWNARCSAEAMAEGLANKAGENSNAEDTGVVEGIWGGTSAGEGMTLNPNLISVGGGALLPSVEIEGQAWTLPAGFFDAIAAIRLLIIAICTVTAMFIVGRNI